MGPRKAFHLWHPEGTAAQDLDQPGLSVSRRRTAGAHAGRSSRVEAERLVMGSDARTTRGHAAAGERVQIEKDENRRNLMARCGRGVVRKSAQTAARNCRRARSARLCDPAR